MLPVLLYLLVDVAATLEPIPKVKSTETAKICMVEQQRADRGTEPLVLLILLHKDGESCQDVLSRLFLQGSHILAMSSGWKVKQS